MNKLEKLDDTKNKSWWKWVLVGLAALGSVLFLFLGDKRSARLMVQRKKEIHKGQKDAKIDLAVGSKEAIQDSQRKLSDVKTEYEDRLSELRFKGTMSDDEVFEEWDRRS